MSLWYQSASTLWINKNLDRRTNELNGISITEWNIEENGFKFDSPSHAAASSNEKMQTWRRWKAERRKRTTETNKCDARQGESEHTLCVASKLQWKGAHAVCERDEEKERTCEKQRALLQRMERASFSRTKEDSRRGCAKKGERLKGPALVLLEEGLLQPRGHDRGRSSAVGEAFLKFLN